MDRYARLRMLLWRKQMSASAIYPKDGAILPTLLGDRDGAKRGAGDSSQGNCDPTRRSRCDEHRGCLRHALRSVVPAPPGVVMVALVGNSADLVVSQGELRRIPLPRTRVNSPGGAMPTAALPPAGMPRLGASCAVPPPPVA